MNLKETAEMVMPVEADMLTQLFNLEWDMNVLASNDPRQLPPYLACSQTVVQHVQTLLWLESSELDHKMHKFSPSLYFKKTRLCKTDP